MATATQANRPLAIETALGPDKLLLRRFTGREELGRMFEINVEMISDEKSISADELIGTNVTVRFNPSDPDATVPTRYFNGYVSHFAHVGFEKKRALYRAVIVPWLWFLTRTADCRIFQENTVQEIIEEIFRDAGFSDFEFRLQETYDALEFCVQYRETDFNFVSRLCEQFGIYYLVKHENGKHTVIFTDSVDKIREGNKKIPYRWDPDSPKAGYGIFEWQIGKDVKSGAFVHNDFDFKNPKGNLLSKSQNPHQHAQAGGEVFDFPGEYYKKGHGDGLARIRLEEMQADHETARARTNDQELFAGAVFTMEDCPMDDQNRGYLVTTAALEMNSDDYTSGAGGGGELDFACSFSAIPDAEFYRALRVTPKPAITGPQTAIVVGPKGEEIYTDEHGRVKVKFHWDRRSKADQNSSCFIRVSQPWAGKNWGAVSIPRIGQEVIVEFLEGDPDRPIITGRVYNGDCIPPYGLPDNRTRTGWTSLSSKGGGGHNELRFEDKKGDEHIYLHAEKNRHTRVKSNEYKWIGNERHAVVKQDDFEKIEGDQHLVVEGDYNEKVDGTISTQAGGDYQQKVGTNHAVDAGMEIHLKAGMNLVLEAGTSITLKAGGNFITLGPAGIAIKGTMVMINSGGAAGSGSGASPDVAEEAKVAMDSEPGEVTEASPAEIEVTSFSPASVVLKNAAKEGTPFCEECAKAAAAGKEGGNS